MDPWDALAHNSTMAVGALSAAEGLVILRHVVTLAAAAEAPAIMRVLASETARLRQLLSTRVVARAVEIFANFGE
jgi:hypothetical protein